MNNQPKLILSIEDDQDDIALMEKQPLNLILHYGLWQKAMGKKR
jgi:hypothetical protein